MQVGEQNWLIDLAEAGEVMPCPPITAVPLTRGWFRGVANVRGNLYSVVDFAEFLGSGVSKGEQARLVLLGERFRSAAALLVDRSLGLRNPAELRARAGIAGAAWLRAEYGTARHAGASSTSARWCATPHFLPQATKENRRRPLCSAPCSLSPSPRSSRGRARRDGVYPDRIVLGQAAVFTGPAAQLGIQMRNGIKAYFDYVNAKGGCTAASSSSSPRTTATSRRSRPARAS